MIMVQTGKIAQVIGPVIDVDFKEGQLPKIHDALYIALGDRQVWVEVARHLSKNTVRCIALQATEGLSRGLKVVNTGSPIQMPVGKSVLGRTMDVLGNPIDNKGPIPATERLQFTAVPRH